MLRNISSGHSFHLRALLTKEVLEVCYQMYYFSIIDIKLEFLNLRVCSFIRKEGFVLYSNSI